MIKPENQDYQEMYLTLVRLFEELKNKFYETNHKLQQTDTNSSERLRLITNFQIFLHQFELKLVDIKEQLFNNPKP